MRFSTFKVLIFRQHYRAAIDTLTSAMSLSQYELASPTKPRLVAPTQNVQGDKKINRFITDYEWWLYCSLRWSANFFSIMTDVSNKISIRFTYIHKAIIHIVCSDIPFTNICVNLLTCFDMMQVFTEVYSWADFNLCFHIIN